MLDMQCSALFYCVILHTKYLFTTVYFIFFSLTLKQLGAVEYVIIAFLLLF